MQNSRLPRSGTDGYLVDLTAYLGLARDYFLPFPFPLPFLPLPPFPLPPPLLLPLPPPLSLPLPLPFPSFVAWSLLASGVAVTVGVSCFLPFISPPGARSLGLTPASLMMLPQPCPAAFIAKNSSGVFPVFLASRYAFAISPKP